MKTNTLPPYVDRFDRGRQDVFRKLKAFADRFVLAGGTAMMLQIGHRLSYDFDCFSLEPFTEALESSVHKIYGSDTTLRVNTGEVMTFTTRNNIEITFVYHPFPFLQTPVPTTSIALFHLDDLAAHKAYTIGRRGAWRDYVDIFILLKWDLYTMQALIELAGKKFGNEFSDKLFLEQLTYYEDLNIVQTKFLKDSYKPSEIKEYLGKSVEEYLKSALQ